MKRSAIKQSAKPMKRTVMARGNSALKAKTPMKPGGKAMQRAAKPMRQRSRTNADPRPKTGEAALCRGQPCYLLVPGAACAGVAHDPCHSNQEKHGKGMGLKAHDIYTVPGCRFCHNEIDQGNRFTREEKFALWDQAYARWKPVRDQLKQR